MGLHWNEFPPDLNYDGNIVNPGNLEHNILNLTFFHSHLWPLIILLFSLHSTHAWSFLSMVTTLWRSLAWHVSGAICDRLDSKPTFVLFHNDTRYTRKFKFSIGHVGIAVIVSTNISYQPSYLQVNMISTGTRHGGSKSGVLSVYFNFILLCQNIETSRFN